MTIVRRLQPILQRVSGSHLEGTSHIAGPTPPGDPAGMNGATLPRTIAEVARVAESLGMAIPDACMPGVVANLALLDTHVDALLDRATRGGR
jgi:hypothetical protein